MTNRLKITHHSGAFVFRDMPLQVIIEDPIMRDSSSSYFMQAAELAVFLLKQGIEPNGCMRKHGGNAYFRRLDPVLGKVASRTDPSGIVRV